MSDKGKDVENSPAPAPAELQLSLFRRIILLIIFCCSVFNDAFMTSSMIICVDSIRIDFGLESSIGTWVITAYNLTFGAFLLLAGRLSDVYHPKPIFVCGFFLIGIGGIGGGFAKNIIALAVLRAIQGIGAALTIPSATTMITLMFPNPKSQRIALTGFAMLGTLGLCLGFIVGGTIVQFVTWRWVMWITALVTLPLSFIATFAIPGKNTESKATSKNMDGVGIAIITSALVLLVFALSQAPVIGWSTARVLAPLIISLLMIIGFFYWQTCIPHHTALIPPRLWFIPNFFVLVSASFTTAVYFIGPIFIFSEYWAASYKWTPLTVSLHVLPIGITSAIVTVVLTLLGSKIPTRPALICAYAVCGLFSILLAFASSKDRYWSFVFPAIILTTIGGATAYILSNVGIVMSVPPEEVGIAAAIFNSALQIGGAVTTAIISTILAEQQLSHPYPSYKAPSSAMWFIVALGVFQSLMFIIFFKSPSSISSKGSDEDASATTTATETTA